MSRSIQKCREEEHHWVLVREQHILNPVLFKILAYFTVRCCGKGMQRMKTVGTFRCERCNATKQELIAEFGECQTCRRDFTFWGKDP